MALLKAPHLQIPLPLIARPLASPSCRMTVFRLPSSLHSQNLPFTKGIPNKHSNPLARMADRRCRSAHNPCSGSAPHAVSRGCRLAGAFPEAFSNGGASARAAPNKARRRAALADALRELIAADRGLQASTRQTHELTSARISDWDLEKLGVVFSFSPLPRLLRGDLVRYFYSRRRSRSASARAQ